MNDNDLIRRGDAIRALYDCYYYNGTGNEKVPLINFREAHGRIKKLPAVANMDAVPQEMSAREFVKTHHRMCQSGISCDECGITHDGEVPRSCVVLMGINPEDTVAIVEKWAREHPERSEE